MVWPCREHPHLAVEPRCCRRLREAGAPAANRLRDGEARRGVLRHLCRRRRASARRVPRPYACGFRRGVAVAGRAAPADRDRRTRGDSNQRQRRVRSLCCLPRRHASRTGSRRAGVRAIAGDPNCPAARRSSRAHRIRIGRRQPRDRSPPATPRRGFARSPAASACTAPTSWRRLRFEGSAPRRGIRRCDGVGHRASLSLSALDGGSATPARRRRPSSPRRSRPRSPVRSSRRAICRRSSRRCCRRWQTSASRAHGTDCSR